MSNTINEEKNKLIINKNIITESPKREYYKPNKTKNSFDENDRYEFLKDKTSPNSPHKSNDTSEESINQKTQEEVNNPSDKKTDKIISPFIGFFLCNEQYIKEKMPEGNDYKKKSKNYILKNNFINLNKIKFEDLDLNKVNDILQDIEYVQNHINNNYLKNHLNYVNNENSFFNKLSIKQNIQNNNFNLDFCASIGNYKYDCKTFILLII